MTAEAVVVVNNVQDERGAIAGLCVRYGVARLDVVGSALRDDFRPSESDIDLPMRSTETRREAPT